MKLRYDDESHGYWLDGKRCKSVTTVAKIPDDLYRLQQWEKRQVAIGLAQSSDLLEAVAAHVDDDDILNGLCNQAKELAGANRGSRRGTAAHRVTERHDAGQDVIATPLATSILAGWTEVLEAAGLEVIPELMERIVVYPNEKICGKFDRIARTRKGRLVILDLKSGARAIDYPHAAAIQLALYANAPLMAAELDSRGEAHSFVEMPDVDKRWGVLVHLPEDGPARAVRLDIQAGWETARDICFPTLRWRARRKEQLVVPLAQIMPAKPQGPDEGAPLSEIEVNALRKAFKECPDRIVVDAWLKQSFDAGRSFNVAGPGCSPTYRRRRIIEAAITWSAHEDDVVRAALAMALGQEIQPAVTTGCAFGSLTIDEAVRLNFFGEALNDGGLLLTFAEDGTPVLSEPQPVPAA